MKRKLACALLTAVLALLLPMTMASAQENLPPVANAGGPYAVGEGSLASLDGSGSSDPDDGIALYEWDLDNDGQYDDATGISAAVTFYDNGTFTVGLRVTDVAGAFATDSAEVVVSNVAPSVDAIPDTTVVSGDTVAVSATFSDPGTLDTHTAAIDWGDGNSEPATVVETNGSGTATGSHVYYIPGTYTVTVTVTDDDGGSGSATFTVEVEAIQVTIDIKPGSDTNPINLGSNGVIPVAILTDGDFDAANVDPDTVLFGPDEAQPVQSAIEDVDGDGDLDMILHFRTQEVGLGEGDTDALLTGQTMDGKYFEGTDVVRIILPKGNSPTHTLKGKDAAPGQNKDPGSPADGLAKGKGAAPGQNK